jgi:transcriptional regulator with XRE-family HTH domain
MLKSPLMSGLAQRIRQAREQRGYSIEDVERALRIRRRYLTAIELGDYSQLPDGPASRGFVKNFARHVGLDGEEALSQFEAEFGIPVIQLKEDIPPPPSRERPESEYTRIAPPDLRWKGDMPDRTSADLDNLEVSEDIEMGVGVTVPEISRLDGTTGRAVVIRPDKPLRAARSPFRMKRGRPVPGLDTPIDAPRRISGRPSMYRLSSSSPWDEIKPYLPRILGAFGVVALIAGLAYIGLPGLGNGTNAISAWWNRPSATRAPGTVPAANTPDAGTTSRPKLAVTILAPVIPKADGAGAIANTPAANSAPAGTPEAPNAARTQTVKVAPGPGGGMRIAIKALESAPIKVIVDGNLVFNGTPQKGFTLAWNAQKTITIESSSAASHEISINGEVKGPMGAEGERVRNTYEL